MRATRAMLGAGFVAVAAAAASGDEGLRLAVGNGDRLRGTLQPADQVERVTFACPPGALIAADAHAGAGRASVTIALEDGAGAVLAEATRRAPRLRQSAGPGTRYAVVVRSASLDEGRYAVRVRWTSPRRADASAALDAGEMSVLEIPVDAGARIAVRASAPRGSAAVPALVAIADPGGATLSLGGTGAATHVAGATGLCTLTYRNAGAAAGDVAVVATIVPPRARSRALAATNREIPPGTAVVAAAVIGPDGGRLDAPDGGALAGTSVVFPPRALARPAVAVLGALPDLLPPAGRATRATEGVFVGPSGRRFGAIAPSVTVPVAPSGLPAAATELRVEALAGRATTEPVTLVAYDAGAGTATFTPHRLSLFQGFHVRRLWSTTPQVVEQTGHGLSLALGEDVAFVGAPYESGPGGEAQAGLVRVFERVDGLWSPTQTLRAPAVAAQERFGWGVAYVPASADGPASLLVSAPRRAAGADLFDGAIDVFTEAGGVWTHSATIASPFGTRADAFGQLLAADGDRAAVTAVKDTAFGAPSRLPGVAVLARSEGVWTLDQEVALDANGLAAPASLSIAGDVLAVGVPDDAAASTGAQKPGSVYVSERFASGWSAPVRVRVHDGAFRDSLGYAVATDAARVAAFGYFSPSPNPGDALVFAGPAWSSLDHVLTPAVDETARSGYGHAAWLALDGDTLLAGTTSSAGTYVWRRLAGEGGAWFADLLLVDAAAAPPDGLSYFGGPVALRGTTVAVLGTYRTSSSATAQTTRLALFEIASE